MNDPLGLTSIEIEAPAETIFPSPVVVAHHWLQVEMEADKIDRLLISMKNRLSKLSKWASKGFVRVGEIEADIVWYNSKVGIVREMLQRYMGYFEQWYEDGSGI